MRRILLFILLFITTFFLFPSPISAESTIRINEIYPDPNKGEKEWIEIYIENPELTNIEDYKIEDEDDHSTPLLSENLNGNLLWIETKSVTLNNTGDHIYLIKTSSNEIIDDLCYVKTVPEGSLCHKVPPKGQTISYFAEPGEFKVTSPTKGQKNWLVNLDFQILNSDNNAITSAQKGEFIYLDNRSKTYGIPNSDDKYRYFTNGVEVVDLKINTEPLAIGTHTLTLKFIDSDLGIEESISKELTVLENLDGLIISEVFPNPKGADETGVNEWVEIFNSTDRAIQLQGLNLVRIGNSSTYTYTFGESYLITSGEYYLLYPSSFSLTNSEGLLQLQDNAGTVIDELGYSTAVEEETSVIRFEDKIKITTTPTPGNENIYTPTLEDLLEQAANNDFSNLEINTVLPNPEGSDEIGETEWIEVCNLSSKGIDLFGLTITQETSKVSSFTIVDNIKIEAEQCQKIFVDFSINNTAAILQLQNQNGVIFDTVSYDLTTKENQILAREGDELIPQEEKVLGEVIENIIQITIQDAKSQPEDSQVKVTGTVTVEPDLVGNDIYYIQDGTGGVQISSNSACNLKVGDEVQIIGSIGSYHSEIRITSEAEDTIGSVDPPDPLEVKVNEFTPNLVGSLIIVSGTVTKTSGNTIYINDGTGEIKVYIKDSTGIERPACRKGYYAKVTGILSVWDTNDDGELSYRLLPRYQEDVWISETLAGTGENILPVILIGCLLVSLFCRLSLPLSFRQPKGGGIPSTPLQIPNFKRFLSRYTPSK